jgi:hypothetical protein
VDHRDPRPRRPPVRRALHPGEARRQDRHRQTRSWSCRTPSARSSTKAPSSSATARSSTPCSRMATPTILATMQAFAMYTPGHTPACMVHVMGNAAFVGDTLFMPDGGSARADFPGGDAGTLYDSIQKVLTPARRDASVHVPRLWSERPRHPVGNHRRRRKGPQHPCRRRQDREDFIKFRTERDAQLAMPR